MIKKYCQNYTTNFGDQAFLRGKKCISLSPCLHPCLCLSSVIGSDAALWRLSCGGLLCSLTPLTPISQPHMPVFFYEQGSYMHERASLIYLLSRTRLQAWPLGLLVL